MRKENDMSRVTDARNELQQYEATKPGAYQSQYSDKINDTMGQLEGMKTFSYDPEKDAAFTQYKNNTTRRAKLANENAQASASALTGGYGSSYGTQAGQNAYQNAMSSLDAVTDSLYDQAYSSYNQKKSNLKQQLAGYQAAEQQDYSQYQDQLSDWYNGLNYYQNKYDQASNEQQQTTSNWINGIGQVVQFAAKLIPLLFL